MKVMKEHLNEQQRTTRCNYEVFQRRKYKLLFQLGEKNTRFIDRRALRADRAAITSHEAISLIYKARRLDDSWRFSGD